MEKFKLNIRENYLRAVPAELKNIVAMVQEASKLNGLDTYLVGGFVRDLLLGIKNLDLDLVVEGDGIKLARYLSEAIGCRYIVHHRFGTATLHAHAIKIDIASSRKEKYPLPACLPVVEKGAFCDDLSRRDFTINAMAIKLSGNNAGRISDIFCGINDLAAGRVRVLHPRSFIDDPTRILRAVRFEQRYSFSIEPATLKLLKQAAASGMLDKVQPHRVRDELVLLLKEDRCIESLRRLSRLYGLGFIFPHLQLSAGTLRLLRACRRELAWIRKEHGHLRRLDEWLVYFCALISPLSALQASRTARKFALGKGDYKRILDYKRKAMKLRKQLGVRSITPSSLFHLLEPESYEVIILIKAGAGSLPGRRVSEFFRLLHRTRLHITGKDLMAEGINPGPAYQKIMRRVLNAKLNGRVKSRQDELELLRKLIQ